MIDFIKQNDDILIICNNVSKNKILDVLYQNKIIPMFKMMDLVEFIKKMTFDYDTKTIFYLMKKYKWSYENALVYLQNMYYVKDQNYESLKLRQLLEIKKELLANNLLIFDDTFKQSVLDKKIYFYNIETDYKYIDTILPNKNYEIINDEQSNTYIKPIYLFETMQDEISYVCEEISKLIEQNISIDNIKLTNIPNDYFFMLENIFNFYGLKVNLPSHALYGTIIGKYFLDNIESDIHLTIQKIKEHFVLDEETLANIDIIIDICNKYPWCHDYKEIKDMLVYELKHVKCYQKKYSGALEIVDIDSMDINRDDYIFLLSFNQENIPKIYKDDSFITDEMKKELGVEATTELNETIKNHIIKTILNMKNLIITSKKKTNFHKYYLSSLNDVLQFEVTEKKSNYLESYSPLYLKLELGKRLDDYVKYGVKSDILSLLISNFKDIEYRKYNNNYTQIDKDKLLDYLSKKLLLSYTSIDNFYKCQFKFYINNILKLDPFQNNFSAFIGSLVHHMLENCFKENFNYEQEFSHYMDNCNCEIQPKEKFLLQKISDELKIIIEVMHKQKKLTHFTSELYEQKIYIEKKHHIKVTLMGIIDKIMFMEKDGETYVSIVDYKTGNISVDLKKVRYGLTLQLPMYAYLISQSHLFSKPIISGLYYQKLFSPDIEATTKEEYNQKKYDNLKLMGLSTNDENILKEFDSTYQNSEMIRGMKTTNNGFSYYSKVFSSNELDFLLKITDDKINEAIDGICNADFKINPKEIDGENVSCEYCKYKDLCYMNENNKQVIEGD